MPPGNFVSTPQEAELDRLLATIEEHVDLDGAELHTMLHQRGVQFLPVA